MFSHKKHKRLKMVGEGEALKTFSELGIWVRDHDHDYKDRVLTLAEGTE